MKTSLFFLMALLGTFFVHADNPSVIPNPPTLAPPSDNPGAPISPATATTSAAPDSANLPGAGFTPDRYEALWTKSPFAVATSETVGEESPDYFLVGVANQDGVFYASVIERQNQEHFLLTSDKPVRGLTLKSINRSRDGMSTFAEVVKDGQPLTLKLEQAPAGPGGGPMAGNMSAPGAIPMPGSVPPQIPMPGAGAFPNNGSVRPFTRFHRPPIRLPPGQPVPSPAATPTTPPPNPP
jgi:hypothetical protein